MKKLITFLLLAILLGIIPPPSPAQQNQNQETEAFKKQILELENEKLDLQAKLADANAKLANTDFGKFESELRESNNKWLREWSYWFLGVIGTFVVIIAGVSTIFWFWLKTQTNQLIGNEVEKNLNGFKDAVEEQNVIKNQLGVLEKEYAATILDREFMVFYFEDGQPHHEQIRALRTETLLQVFGNEIYGLVIRYRAAGVLASRKSPKLVAPLLEFLNSAVDSDSDIHFEPKNTLRGFVNLFAYIPTEETYQGLTKFLNRLLTENSEYKSLILMGTVSSLAEISIQLDRRDSVPMLIRAMSHFEHPGHEDLSNLASYFDMLDEPAGIKEILTNHVTNGMPDVEEKCLELLQKHDPELVEQWRARETTNNST